MGEKKVSMRQIAKICGCSLATVSYALNHTGQGKISSATRLRIIDTAKQLNYPTTRTTREMGLGIPLLRLAAEQTGGRVSIESTLGVGTTVTAVFCPGHIDCPPVGDMAGTVTLLVQGAPELELTYTHRRGDRLSRLDTGELRAVLGPEVSLAEPEVVLWLRDYLQEQEALLEE